MKKSIVVAISAVAAVALGACAYLFLCPQKPVVFEAIVPDNAIYYVVTTNLNQRFRDLKNSTFFTTLSGTSLYKNNIGPGLDKLDSKAPFLKDFMEKDIGAAILSLGHPADPSSENKYEIESAGDILLLVRVDRNKLPQVKRRIAEAYLNQRSGKVSAKLYEGVRISTYKAPSGEQVLSYAILSDTVLVSTKFEDIQKCVALYKNKSNKSLANSASFRKACARVKKGSLLWGYKNGKNYYADYLRQVQETTDPLQKTIMSQMQPIMSLMAALDDASFYVDYDKEAMAFVSKTYTGFDVSKDESGFIDIIARDKALDQKIFSLIPHSALAYYACSQDMLKCYDFWMKLICVFANGINMQAGPGPAAPGPRVSLSPDAMIRRAEYYLGIDIRKDLISLLGDDIGLVFAGIDDVTPPLRMPRAGSAAPAQSITRNISVPQIYLFCATKDADRLGKVMDGVFQKMSDNINAKAKEARERYKKLRSSSGAGQAEEGQSAEEDAPLAQDEGQPAEEEKPTVACAVENFNDSSIRYLAFTDSPFPFLEPNYCIVDKYLVFSLSRSLTKRIVQNYRSSSGVFDINAQPACFKDALSSGYSAVFYCDFQGIVNSVARSSSFKGVQPMLTRNPKLGLSSSDLDLLITALGTIHQFIATVHKVPGEDMLESQGILTVQE